MEEPPWKQILAARANASLILEDISVLGVEGDYRERLTVYFESRRAVVGCPECGVVARVKDRPAVTLVDLSINGRPVSLI